MSEPTETDKENDKAWIRSALDILENYMSSDGKIDATKLTQELTTLRAQLEEANEVIKSSRGLFVAIQDLFKDILHSGSKITPDYERLLKQIDMRLDKIAKFQGKQRARKWQEKYK